MIRKVKIQKIVFTIPWLDWGFNLLKTKIKLINKYTFFGGLTFTLTQLKLLKKKYIVKC